MIQKNSLLERIENIDYTHLLGYPAEVVAVEVIAMVKDVVCEYMDKVVEQLEEKSFTSSSHAFEFSMSKYTEPKIVDERSFGEFRAFETAIEIVKKGGVADET